ncbi:unnamed protein product [Albugo candida]|uniref:CCHC-type domain-containing protein n=1 Tax=Albugo candida TaxID=65357 RepID=A0A024G505_9STRA|nr:unnamed protein product [Albugo candida]|eukprot:CCI41914.1 unnamed protein product [Albugo candida]
MPIGIEIALKRINDEYGNSSNHRERALLDYVLVVTEIEIRDPVQMRTRGRPSSSTQRIPSKFEHVSAALDAPVHRRRCRKCQKTGHTARTCRQEATAHQQHQQHLQHTKFAETEVVFDFIVFISLHLIRPIKGHDFHEFMTGAG